VLPVFWRSQTSSLMTFRLFPLLFPGLTIYLPGLIRTPMWGLTKFCQFGRCVTLTHFPDGSDYRQILGPQPSLAIFPFVDELSAATYKPPHFAGGQFQFGPQFFLNPSGRHRWPRLDVANSGSAEARTRTELFASFASNRPNCSTRCFRSAMSERECADARLSASPSALTCLRETRAISAFSRVLILELAK
jgi:hypothetical protein